MTTVSGAAVRWPRSSARAGDLRAAALLALTAGAVGALLAAGHTRMALLAAAAPVALVLALNFRIATVLLAVSLPFPMSLLGGGAGLSVAASDLLLALLLVVVTVNGLRGRLVGLGAAVKPAMLVFAPYLAWLVVLLAAHTTLSDTVQTAQRLELFLVPVLIGAAIGLRGHVLPVLRAYLLTATAFAALYPFFSTGGGGLGAQKNPAGQFIANGLILMLALKPLRSKRLLPAVPVLVLGLLWTLSRGAIVSVGIAVVVLALTHRGQERRRFVLMLAPLAIVAAGAFALLPQQAKARNTDFSTARGTAAAASLDARFTYQAEAWQLIHQQPVFGLGIGNYVKGTPTVKPSSADPHEVLLLQAAEGGYPLALAFAIMAIGTVGLVFSTQRRVALGAAAGAVIVACIGHGLVDVYWVRGTPVLGWLLLGMLLGMTHHGGVLDSRRHPTREGLPA